MTKEEYEKLLKSDYWKGYSYSLIKERNFTCEDCGRTFYNERNKLQVHHLIYRDTNPWSYKPEELIVLCEECHKRRHGIITDEMPISEPDSHFDYIQNERMWVETPTRKIKLSYVLYVILILFFIWIGVNYSSKSDNVNNTEIHPRVDSESLYQNVKQDVYQSQNSKESSKQVVKKKASDNNEVETFVDNVLYEKTTEEVEDKSQFPLKNEKQESISEILDNNTHKQVIDQAKRAGVSTEGSTSEILDRITHKQVVDQAKRAGVSTEGSTSEILDRITHKQVVDQAKRAGVSTEGSTSEILDRVTHKQVVDQAKRAGVSTEGSTSEILDRITRKNMEKYAQ